MLPSGFGISEKKKWVQFRKICAPRFNRKIGAWGGSCSAAAGGCFERVVACSVQFYLFLLVFLIKYKRNAVSPMYQIFPLQEQFYLLVYLVSKPILYFYDIFFSFHQLLVEDCLSETLLYTNISLLTISVCLNKPPQVLYHELFHDCFSGVVNVLYSM